MFVCYYISVHFQYTQALYCIFHRKRAIENVVIGCLRQRFIAQRSEM